MAIFGKKEKKPASKAEKIVADKVVKIDDGRTALADERRVIIRPRITEKATLKAESENVYVFEIAQDANKANVKKAVKALYKVNPRKVSITRNPSKKVFVRGKRGVVSGVKKAYVYLKSGDKIEIV